MKNNFRHLRVILFFAIILFFGFYIKHNIGDFGNLKFIKIVDFAFLIILFLSSIIINGIFLTIILNKVTNKQLKTSEGIYLSCFSAIGNFISFFQGGVGARGLYLKNKYGLAYNTFISTVVVQYLLLFSVFGTVGIIGLLYSKNFSFFLLFIIACISYGGIIVVIFWNYIPKNLKELKFRPIQLINKSFEQILSILLSIKLISSLVTLVFIRLIISATLNYVIFNALNIPIELGSILLYTSIVGLSIIINLTPASLGFREGIMILYKDVMSLNTNEILEAAIIDRSILTIVLFFLFIVISLKKNKTIQ